MFQILGQAPRFHTSGQPQISDDKTSHVTLEPVAQPGTFERIADWLFLRKLGERFLLVRSYPFNVIEVTAAEIDILRAYFDKGRELPRHMAEVLVGHHFLDPEPDGSNELNRHTSAILLLTTACNLRCRGCFASGGDYGLGASHMSDEVIDATVYYLSRQVTAAYEQDGFRGKATLGLHFFGGEPFIVFDKLKYAVERTNATAELLSDRCGRSIRPDFVVTTNGTLLRPKMVEFLKQHRISVLLSIDGPQHDERRQYASGKGSLAKAMETFRELRKEGIHTRLNTVVLGEDVAEFRRIVEWFRAEVYAHEPDAAVYHTFSFQREGPGSPVAECATSYPEHLMHEYIGTLDEFNSAGYQLYEVQLRKKLEAGGTFYKCSSGVKRIAVAPDGGVYPCQGFVDRSFEMGSILDQNFDHRSTPISQCFSRRNIANLLPCRNCVFAALCPHNVDCAARAHYTLGGVKVIDVNGMCRIGFQLMDRILFERGGLWTEGRSE